MASPTGHVPLEGRWDGKRVQVVGTLPIVFGDYDITAPSSAVRRDGRPRRDGVQALLRQGADAPAGSRPPPPYHSRHGRVAPLPRPHRRLEESSTSARTPAARRSRHGSSVPVSTATSARTPTTTRPRTSRATTRPGSASSRRSCGTAVVVEGPRGDVVEAGTIVEIKMEGDDDTSEYLVGSIEERHDELDVLSTSSPLGQALIGHGPGDVVSYEGPAPHVRGRDRERPHRRLTLRGRPRARSRPRSVRDGAPHRVGDGRHRRPRQGSPAGTDPPPVLGVRRGRAHFGWIATGPTPVKRANLDHSPFVSVTYWAPNPRPLHRRVPRHVALRQRDPRAASGTPSRKLPPPVGYDPAMIPPWADGPRSEAFAVLRLDPWRLRVLPGTIMTKGEGEELRWSA